MDPTANLQEQRRLAAKIVTDPHANKEDADRLAELVEALDEWLSKGGFLPEQWRFKVQGKGVTATPRRQESDE